MKTDVFNRQNDKVGIINLPDEVFSVEWNPDLVHQALKAQLAGRRQVLAHAKGRGEVRGGGRKPWRQKGTGRARHGSVRSPLWPGGGVTFGPTKERVFAERINKKMKKKALFCVLSRKLKDGELKILDSFKTEGVKTKEWAKTLAGFFPKNRPNVLLVDGGDKETFLSSRNLKGVGSVKADSLNVRDLLKFKNVFLERKAVDRLIGGLSGK